MDDSDTIVLNTSKSEIGENLDSSKQTENNQRINGTSNLIDSQDTELVQMHSSEIDQHKLDNKSNKNEDQKTNHTSVQSVCLDTEKCPICGQFLNNSDIIYYQGHPQNAVEEFIALTNEKLVLASGK